MHSARILIVDDEPSNARLLVRVLERAGYRNVCMSCDPAAVMPLVEAYDPQLLVLDLHMGASTGFDVLAALRDAAPPTRLLPVLVVTADNTAESLHRARNLGADDYLLKPFGVAELVLRVEGLLSMRLACEASHDDGVSLRQQIGDCRYIVTQAELDLLGHMTGTSTPDGGDGHGARVGELAAHVAQRMRLDEWTVASIRAAAPLHDIGKIAVSQDILGKPGALTPHEMQIVSRHTVIGGFLLASTELPLMRVAGEVALYHHERWDGTGYPRGLEGESIPLAARIVAVADVFDALTSVRSYKRAWSVRAALTEIVRLSGTHFDPRVVGALVATVMRRDTVVPAAGAEADDSVLSLADRQRQREAQLHSAVIAGHQLHRSRFVGNVPRRAIVA